ncbi:MAG: aspartate/glutamate racemase family protein, partial [Gammaproteobacteria bacterium]
MKLLLINPNISEDVTAIMAAEARRSASPGTEITAVTARFGALYIENRIEASIASHAVLDALAEHGAGADGAIISAFGDPGLAAARELVDIPVVGVSEAAFLMAWTLGRRYAIVAMTKRLGTWYRECAVEHGLDGRLVNVRALDVPLTD